MYCMKSAFLWHIHLPQYQVFPKDFSLAAYQYLWTNAPQIGKAYGITILNTVIGTTASLLIVSMFAYPLSLEVLVESVLDFDMLHDYDIGGLFKKLAEDKGLPQKER